MGKGSEGERIKCYTWFTKSVTTCYVVSMIESIHGYTASRVRWDDMDVTNFACLHMFNALDEMAVYFFRSGCPPLSTFFSFVFFGLFF